RRELPEGPSARRGILAADQQADGTLRGQVQALAAGRIDRGVERDQRVVGVGGIEALEASGDPPRRPAALRRDDAHAGSHVEEQLRRAPLLRAGRRDERHALAAQDRRRAEAVERAAAGGVFLRAHHEARLAALAEEQRPRRTSLESRLEGDLPAWPD